MQAPMGYAVPPPPSRPGMNPPSHAHSGQQVSLPSINTSPYGAPMSSNHSGSLNGPLGPMNDHMGMPDMNGNSLTPPHGSLAALSAQKRAYRQRRKDPSCDACRERKVKCDATDASSCSECSSRSVKCQFTKETNRRMSSMKQVQDLERQLHTAKQQIHQLKGMVSDNPTPSLQSSAAPSLSIPDGTHNRDRGSLPRAAGNFFKVRRNIRNYGRGVFKPPHAFRTPTVQYMYQDNEPALPSPQLVEMLLSRYKLILHQSQPVLHWPTFQTEVDDLYRSGTFRGMRKSWIGVFYGVLANAALVTDYEFIKDINSQEYIERAIMHVNTLSDEVTIDHARIALLASVYFMETNRRSAAWIWLGSAVRTAQECGLHIEHGNVSPMQAELRKRTWWAIYNWDRFVALEIGQIGDGADPDVEVGEPTPIDDDFIRPDGFQSLESGNGSSNTLLVLVPVGRLIHQLRRTLKSRSITSATLKIYDDHFQSIMDSYPDPFPIGSSTPLDPHYLFAATALQMCKFQLFRHNLTPVSRMQDRHDAIQRCVQVAKDTAHYIWRTTPAAHDRNIRLAVHPPDMSNIEWRDRIKFAVPALVIKHWWRCVLILCFAGEYAPALTIINAMGVINGNRKINLACGRNLAFFLDLMIQKWQSGRGNDVENDEEMLAYASGDLQGSSYSAWAWAGSDSRNNSASSHSPSQLSPPGEPTPETAVAQPALLTDEEEREWGGWPKIEDMVRHLQYLRNSSHPSRTSPYASPESGQRGPSAAPPPQQHYQQPAYHQSQSPYHAPYSAASESTNPRPSPPASHHRGSFHHPPPASSPAPTAQPPTPAMAQSTVSRISIKDIM